MTATKVHTVTAPLAVVTDTSGFVHYLYRGSLVPPGLASADELKRLVDHKLLEASTLEVPDDPPVSIAGASSPPGDPNVRRPANTASKDTWVEYAVSQGMPREEAEAFSRNELAAHYPA